MANTYSQIHIHFVFAVKDRASLIDAGWRARLHAYLAAVAEGRGQKVLAVGGMRDHVHLFAGMTAAMAPSALMADVKRASSLWVNAERLSEGHFGWQEGFGAFSYAHSQIGDVVRYIRNQEEHHRTMTFREEFEAFLRKFQVEHDERYVFHEV